MMRWEEEVQLVREEMRRVLAFLSWQAQWWNDKRTTHSTTSPDQMEGYVAYASRQAALRIKMRDHFIVKWRHVEEYIVRGVDTLDDEVFEEDEEFEEELF
jgi:hypothetical protein